MAVPAELHVSQQLLVVAARFICRALAVAAVVAATRLLRPEAAAVAVVARGRPVQPVPTPVILALLAVVQQVELLILV
jgi:hypothetical protein